MSKRLFTEEIDMWVGKLIGKSFSLRLYDHSEAGGSDKTKQESKDKYYSLELGHPSLFCDFGW